MRFENLLTRSAAILRRHLWLWLLALLAGEGSGWGGSSNASGSFNTTSTPANQRGVTPPDVSWVPGWVQDRAGLLLELGAALLVVLFLLFLLSCIAEGALIAAAARIDAGEKVGFGAAWRSGMDAFWRVLGFRLLTALLVLLPLLLLLLPPAAGYLGWGNNGFLKGLLLALPLLVAGYLFILAVSVLSVLALRACVLDGRGPIAAYRAAIALVRRRFTRFGLTWLILLAVGIGIGILMQIVLSIAAVPFTAPLTNEFVAGDWSAIVTTLATLVAVTFPISLVLSSLAGAYFSTAWTVAYRRLDAEGEIPEPAPLAA